MRKNANTAQTASEFLEQEFTNQYNTMPDSFKSIVSLKRHLELNVYGRTNGTEKNLVEMLVEFTETHVKSALKTASKKVKRKEGQIVDSRLTASILAAYSSKNIK
jgi:hypothetical protein